MRREFFDGVLVTLPPDYLLSAMAVVRALLYRTRPAPAQGARALDCALRVRDATSPAALAALQGAEKGMPVMPLCGVLGSDLVDARGD